jgi:serine protease Do
VDAVRAAVVNIEVTGRARSAPREFEEFFERFAPPGPGGGAPPFGDGGGQLLRGAGSGFVIDGRGQVLTNSHVVEGASSIRVRLEDGRAFDAKVMGRDPLTDLALLLLVGLDPEVQRLPVVRLGDSDALRVGDWVVAIGNPFGLASSVSVGILSARARDINVSSYDDFLQTDAAINPGNSGGPLFDMRGEVVGINTAIVGGGAGIGFAVPSNIAKTLLPQLEKGERIQRGWLGVSVQTLTPELARGLGVAASGGAVIGGVTPGTPAHKSGIRPDDVIVAVDGKPVDSAGALTRAIGFKVPGRPVKLTVLRGNDKKEITVPLGTRPDLEGIARSDSGMPPGQQQREIGFTYSDVDPRLAERLGVPPKGVMVTEVAPGSPADRAGLRPGMVVVEAGGKAVARAGDLTRTIRRAKPGSVLVLRIQAREGKFLVPLELPGGSPSAGM